MVTIAIAKNRERATEFIGQCVCVWPYVCMCERENVCVCNCFSACLFLSFCLCARALHVGKMGSVEEREMALIKVNSFNIRLPDSQ